MDVSIIIVNYNTKDLTAACIDSIFQWTTGISFEVILVDNGSVDGSVDHFLNDGRIKFFPTGKNLGFGLGNNYGAQYASGKYIFLLNSDTILLNNAVELFFQYFEEHKNQMLGVIGCVLTDEHDNEIQSFVPFKSIAEDLRMVKRKVREKIFRGKPIKRTINQNEEFEVDAVLGADMFVPAELYREVGGFDPDYFLYGEEVDLQKRISDKGYRRVIIRQPRIVHLEGGSSANKGKRLSYSTIYLLKKGALTYIKKHRTSLYFYLYVALQAFTWLPWIWLDNRFNTVEKKRAFNLLFKIN